MQTIYKPTRFNINGYVLECVNRAIAAAVISHKPVSLIMQEEIQKYVAYETGRYHSLNPDNKLTLAFIDFVGDDP